MLYILVGIVWYSIGVASFNYFWYSNYEDLDGCFVSLALGLLGPVTTLIAYHVHKDEIRWNKERKKERQYFKFCELAQKEE